MSDQEGLCSDNTAGNPDAGPVKAAEAAKVFALKIDRRPRSILIDPGTRLINDQLADEGHHPVRSFDHLKASHRNSPASLSAVELDARVDKPVELLKLFLVTGKSPLGVGVRENQVLFDASQREVANRYGSNRRAAARHRPAEEDAEEGSSGEGPDQSERMVSRTLSPG